MEYRKEDLITVVIEDMGIDGAGIGKIDGFTFFVKDAVIGDMVEAKIMKVKKGYAYARLMNIITPSTERTEPKCQYHKQCGGCQIQALNYKRQLLFKTDKVKNNLQRIGGFSLELLESIMEPIIGMDTQGLTPYHYRNKAQFPVGEDKNGEIVTGFYAGRTHVIIPNTECALGVEENKKILEAVIQYMKENKITPYNEITGEGIVRHILIRKGFATGEIMTCVIINADTLPHQEKLVNALSNLEGMSNLTININKEKTNVIMGRTCRTIWGNNTITDVIGDISFSISPMSFYQVNPIQTEKLYSLALEYAGLTGEETVCDLYCGIGTISLFMAKKAKKVYGVEIVEQAIEDARKNAERNHIDNAEFYVGKAEEVLPRLYEEEGLYADVICVDPPRKGCDEECLATMVKMAPKRIVYVSCDSATLARDLKYLCANGYELKRICPVDMFPQTVHVETCVLLSRKKSGS
ncbi:MAG: 23S rRNA (uracil(1939)-C(5))-methyltransferase RlmD [Lachnospiraceae bacterium]|nr:23S rRNA (uracil(1939)-C(5))-methyltransferase RlmD [Lachnospiraceae bacterium]